MKYRKRETYSAKQFHKIGDHSSVIEIPKQYRECIPAKHGAIGYVHISQSYTGPTGIFVFPGDWVVTDKYGTITVHRPDVFKETFMEA